MGLDHPHDLAAWTRWQQQQRPLSSRVKGLLTRSRPDAVSAILTTAGPAPRIVIALDARKTTTVKAQLSAVAFLNPADVAILSFEPVIDLLPPASWQEIHGLAPSLARAVVGSDSVVLSTGHYAPLGAITRDLVGDRGQFVTVQHGLLTPHAPPLAAGTTVLSFTDADGDFWSSGRTDVTTVAVGSQLLWEAAQHPATTPDSWETPIFLGQLHAAEIPRETMTQASQRFCLRTGAPYRPHPNETDRLSRAQHARWQAAGITIDSDTTPLAELTRPVVSVFSTGVIEAAARGVPAWVFFEHPPTWLREFWGRYSCSVWGSDPTKPLAQPAQEPAQAIAHHLSTAVGDPS